MRTIPLPKHTSDSLRIPWLTPLKDKKEKEVSEITRYDRNGGNASDHPDDSQLACWGDWQLGKEEM